MVASHITFIKLSSHDKHYYIKCILDPEQKKIERRTKRYCVMLYKSETPNIFVQ